jgi:hypothetical protein
MFQVWIKAEQLLIRIKTTNHLKPLAALGTLVLSLIVLWPILSSPFSGDDAADSLVPMQLKYLGQSPWSFITEYTSNWASTQGRFFPIAATTGVFSHFFFPGRAEYKIVQLLVVLASLLLLGILVSKIFRNFYAGIIAVLVLNTCLQVHVQYDPLTQFSLQQPGLMIYILSSLILFVSALRSGSSLKYLLSAVFYLFALLTYESTVLLWPIYFLLACIERPKKIIKPIAMSAAPAFIVGVNLIWLRSRITTTSPGYTSNFDPARFSETFVKQALGSLPMSYSELRTPPFIQSFPDHLQFNSIWWLLGTGISVLLILLALPRVDSLSHKLNVGIIFLGLVVWFVPAFVVAQTVRWQNELVMGNAYITWFQGSFGFTLIAIGIILECKILLAKFRKSVLIIALSLLALIIGIATSSVITNNPPAVAQYNPGYKWPREVFENSIQAGVFSEVSAKQPVLALGADWWFDPAFVYWWGGPKIERMDSQNANVGWQSCLAEPQTCINRIGYKKVVIALGNDWDSLQKSSPKVVIVGQLNLMTGVPGAVSSAIVSAPRIYVEFPKQFGSSSELKAHCQQWAETRVSEKMSSVETKDVVILKNTNKTCLVEFSSRISFDAYKFNLS